MAMGMVTTGQCGSCEVCLQGKVKRHAVPKMTDERPSMRVQQFFVDVGGPMEHSSLVRTTMSIFLSMTIPASRQYGSLRWRATRRQCPCISLQITSSHSSYRLNRWIIMANSSEDFNVNWTGAASRTYMPRQTLCSAEEIRWLP